MQAARNGGAQEPFQVPVPGPPRKTQKSPKISNIIKSAGSLDRRPYTYMRSVVESVVPGQCGDDAHTGKPGKPLVMHEIERHMRSTMLQAERVEREGGRWLEELACNQSALVNSSNLTSAILEQINDDVRTPLAHLLWHLEKRSALAFLPCPLMKHPSPSHMSHTCHTHAATKSDGKLKMEAAGSRQPAHARVRTSSMTR